MNELKESKRYPVRTYVKHLSKALPKYLQFSSVRLWNTKKFAEIVFRLTLFT